MKHEFVDETELTKERESLFAIQGGTIKKAMESRRINTHLFVDVDSAKAYIEEFISKRDYIRDIAFSDGVTLYQMGLFDWILDKYSGGGYTINQPLERSRTGHYAIFGEQSPGRMNIPEDDYRKLYNEWYEKLRRSLMSDLLICSSNAVTMDGEIVSVDGFGNRVSGMIFGPKHVLCIVGRNKIVRDYDAAVSRIHNYTVPLTYLRHNNKHWCNFQDVPCLRTGKCANCSHPESACLNKVVVRGQVKQHQDRIHLLIVNEELGF
jgi:hypothetical protein